MAVGLSKESSLFLALLRATDKAAGGEGQAWIGVALSFHSVSWQLEPLQSIKIQKYRRSEALRRLSHVLRGS